jgi:pyruvate/2-oxoglutarate dehydrogenase complex dihydrolipoamide dehydrogenase (E3) component
MNTQKSKLEGYDLLVLGSGEAGKFLAWTLAKKGMKAAVIERKDIGGSCPNIACLPSKNIIQSAKVASFFRRSEEFGITKNSWDVRMPAVRERKRKMVSGLVDMHLDFYRKSGTELIMGSGRFVGPKTIEVSSAEHGARLLCGEKIVINTGTRATIDPTPGLTQANPLTHIETLELDHVPQHLLVLGGGYVGLELSQAMHRFGSRVTVIEQDARLAHREDQDVSEALHELFEDEGIDVVTNGRVSRVEGESGKLVKLHVNRGESETVIEGTHLLVATGRTGTEATARHFPKESPPARYQAGLWPQTAEPNPPKR